MAIFGQTFLLLKKNVLLRIRYPGILVLELIWPVLVMGLVALMRNGAPPFRKPTCHLQPRAMPSAGAVPFLQTYMCNLDNPCFMTEGELNNAIETSLEFNALTQDIAPYLVAEETINVLAISNQSTTVVTTINAVLQDQNLTQALENFTYVRQYFQDSDEVRRILVNDFGLMTSKESEALMNAQFNIAQLMQLTGTPDFKEVACDAAQLQIYLIFPTTVGSASPAEISEALCKIADSEVPGLVDAVVSELDIVKIMEALEVFEELKEKFTGSSLATIFDELAQMFELVMDSKSIIRTVGSLAAVPDIAQFIRDIPQLLEGFNSLNDGLASVKFIVDSFTPLMVSLGADTSNAWSAVQNAVEMGTNFVLLGEGRWNGTTQEFMQPLTDLIADLNKLSQEEEMRAMVGVLDFMSKQDWLSIYSEIIYTGELSESTVTHMLDTLEQLMSSMPGYDVTQMMSRLAQHTLDVGSIFTEQSTEFRQALYTTLQQSTVLQNKTSEILQYGPDVLIAIMEAFLDSNILTGLFTTNQDYVTVCRDVVANLDGKLDQNVVDGVRDILCTDDVMHSLDELGALTGTTSISNIINETVAAYTKLYEGDFWAKMVPYKDLYSHYMRFTNAINLYLYDGLTWEGVVSGAMSGVDLNTAGWERLLDTLNEDYLIRGILGMYQSLGQIVSTTPVAEDMAPYIHMMSEMVRLTYGVMNTMIESYSMDTPLMSTLQMVTTYLPEMMEAVSKMDQQTMEAIYNIFMSGDPLAAFCASDVLDMMNMPSYVPVNDMKDMVCQTDWTQAIADLSRPVQEMESMINEMMQLIEVLVNPTTPAPTYDVEGDWISMVDYTQRIIDLVNNGDVANMDFTLGYLNYFQSIDLVKLGDGLEMALEMVVNDTTQNNGEGMITVAVAAVTVLDSYMGSDPTWNTVRSMAVVADAYMDMQIAIQEQLNNVSSIRNILAMYPPELTKITEMMAKAYPDFVLFMSNFLYYPERYLDTMLRLGIQTPDCQTQFVSDYFLVSKDSSIYELETYLCSLNWESLAMSLSVSTPEVEAFNQELTKLLEQPDTLTNITVDWVALARKVETYMQVLNLEMDLGNLDLLPFNVTEIDLSWDTFYAALNTIQYWDINRMTSIAAQIQQLAIQSSGDILPANSEIVAVVLYSNSYITHHALKLFNTELAIFNASDTIILSEYLWSIELERLLLYIEKAPEFNAVAMATIQRLLTNPEQAKIPSDWAALCTDLQLFSEVFVVSASSMSAADLQKEVCDVQDIDFEALLDQVLNNRASVREFVEAMELLGKNFTVDDLIVPAYILIEDQLTFTKLLQAIIIDPPVIQLTRGNAWMEESSYTQSITDLTTSLEQLGSQLADTSYLMTWETNVMKSVLPVLATDPNIAEAMVYMEAVLDMIVAQITVSSGDLDRLRQFPNANIMLDLVEEAPQAIETILYTVLTQPDKVSAWSVALQSWPGFCQTPVDTIMTVPDGLNFSMTNFLGKACSLNIESLLAELAEWQGTDRLEQVLAGGALGQVNVTSVIEKINQIVLYAFDTTDSTSDLMTNLPFSRVFDESVWNEIGARVAQWSDSTAASYSSPAQIVSAVTQGLLDSMDFIAPAYFEVVDKAIAVTDVLLGQMINLMDTNSLNSSFNNLPEMQVLVSLLNKVPELYETVLYTAITYPEKISGYLATVQTFEAFCINDPQTMLVLAPGSPFDIDAFMNELCSLNLTKLMEEIEDYSVTQQVTDLINQPYTGTVDVNALLSKVEELVSKLDELNPSDRVFQPDVWTEVMERTLAWIWNYTSPAEFVKVEQQRLVGAFIVFVENTPGAQSWLYYVDTILDIIAASSGSLDGLQAYPNAAKVLELLNEAPEAIETILYTIMTQQDKVTNWATALQSWSTFCQTPVDTIMTVPDGLNFSMSNFLGKACSLDVEVLLAELAAWQGTDRLTQLLTYGPGNYTIDVTAMQHKLDSVIDYYATVSDPTADMSNLVPWARLYDVDVWNGVAARISQWSDVSASNYDSTSSIVAAIAEGIEAALAMVTPAELELVQKAVAIMDIVLDEVIQIMDTNNLNSTFYDLPEMQVLVKLLNQVPELYETLLYTAINNPEKITGYLARVDSLENFCMNDPRSMLVLAPNSPFDLDGFFMDFCTLNLTRLMESLEAYTLTQQITQLWNIPYTGTIKWEDVVSKAESVISRLEQDINPTDQVFDPRIWDQVMERVNTWLWTYDDPVDFITLEQQRLFLSLVAYVENTPGSEDILRYVDAALDLIGNRVETFQDDLTLALADLPNLQLIVGLLEQLPEMIETALYTVLTDSVKTAAWTDALVSFEALCGTPVSSIMTVPPGSSFNVTAYIGQLCKVDIDELVSELTEMRGLDRFVQIANGNDMNQINTTALLLKADQVFSSLSEIYSNPETLTNLLATDLRLFNETVWEQAGQKVAEWAATASVDYSQPENIVQAISDVMESLSAMSPELKDVFDRATAVAAIVVDELALIIQESSLEAAYANISSLRLLIELANEAPELYQTSIYTSLYHPEKATAQSAAFSSLETLCAADPDTLFTVPPGLNFDLKAWMQKFCSLNITLLSEELTTFSSAIAMEQIITGQSVSGANLTSILAKIDEIMTHIEDGVTMTDRVLDPSVWEAAMVRVEGWLANYTIDQFALMSLSSMGDTLNGLSSDPALFDALMILTIPGVIGDEVMSHFLKLESKTTIELVDLVEGWSSMEEVLKLAQLPGAVAIIAASGNNPRFQTLFYDWAAISDFCSAATPLANYLTIPDGVTDDQARSFKDTYCAINFDDFLDGFNNIVDIDRVSAVLEGTVSLDWNDVFSKVERMIELITVTWAKNPPTFYLPEQWLNETYWMQFYEDNFIALEDAAELKEVLEGTIDSLAPFLGLEGLRETGLVLNSVLDILNENIVLMQGNVYTLGTAVENIPALSSLFNSLGLDSGTMLTLLSTPVTNTTKFAELFLSDDFQKDFCTSDIWRDILGFSGSFDTSGLYEAVCVTGDVNPFLNSLVASYDLESLVQALESSNTTGWQNVVEKIFSLIDNVEKLIENPPRLDLDDPALQSVLDLYTNTDDLWQLFSAFSVLQNVFATDGSENGTSSGTSAIVDTLESVFNVPLAITGVLTELMARLKIQNGRLDFAAIFKDVPQIVQLIDSFLDLQPDPLTGVAGVMLKADTVDHMLQIADNATALNELFCNEDKFKQVFTVSSDVDLTALLSAMCGLNFDTIADELADSLGISDLMDDSGFDMEGFASDILKIIGLITNLTDVDTLLFDGRNLGDLGSINITRLAELLNIQYNVAEAFTRDYVIISATILNDLLTSVGNTGAELTVALKFVEVYMKSFNTFLETVIDQPISLQLLMNKTEVGAIINPILADPTILNGLINAKVDIEELAKILQSSDPVTSLCGDDLWKAIQVPDDEKQALVDLQTSACTADQTLVLWQTIMAQASGYQLMQQLEMIVDEISQGETAMNATAVTDEVTQSVTLIQTIIEQFISGERSINDLIDLQSFQDLLASVQSDVAQILLDQADNWSVDLAKLIIPTTIDDSTYQSLAKVFNTANLFMNITIDKLEAIKAGTISLDSLFADANDLVVLIEAYIRVGENIAALWTDPQISFDGLMSLVTRNQSELQAICSQSGAMAQLLAMDSSQIGQVVEDMATLICSVVTESILTEAQSFVEYDKIMKELDTIWSSSSVAPNYEVFAANVREFTELITVLANSTLTVDSSLSNLLDFNTLLSDLQNIGENPEVIFRILQLVGLAVEGPLKADPLATQIMSTLNTYAVLPLTNVLDAMKDKGISLATFTDDPNAFIDILSVMLDFDLHYSVIETVLIKSQANFVARHHTEICDAALQDNSTWIAWGLSGISPPVSIPEVASAICQSKDNGEDILQSLKDIGLSESQIKALMDLLAPLYLTSSLVDMYDTDLGWVELMSNLGTLTSLVTDFSVGQSGVTAMQDTWTTVKNLLLDSGMSSFFSYLQLFESEIPQTQEWKDFKSLLSVMTSVMNFVTENIDGFVAGGTVKMEDVLPSSDRVTQLLDQIFGPSTAAEMLVTIIDPNMVYRITLEDAWREVCTNGVEYYLKFPAGVNVTAVQENLCQAVASRSTAWEELLALFNARDVLVTLDTFIMSGLTPITNATVWDGMSAAILQMVNAAEQLVGTSLDQQSVESWFTALLNWVTALQSDSSAQQLTGLCNVMSYMVKNTTEYQTVRSYLAPMLSSMKLVADLSKIIPGLDDLTCTFVGGQNGFDVTGAINKLASLGLWGDVEQMISLIVNPDAAIDCAAPLVAYQNLSTNIAAAIDGNLDMYALTSCLEAAPDQLEALFSSITSMTNFLKQFLEIAMMPGLTDLLQNEELAPIIDFVINTANSNNSQELVNLIATLTNETALMDYLVNDVGLSVSLVNSFIDSSVTMDWVRLLDNTAGEWVALLCDPLQLAEVLMLPQGSVVNISEVSTALCSQNITDFVGLLADLTLSVDEVELMLTGNMTLTELMADLSKELNDLITELGDIIQLLLAALTDFSFDMLQDQIPVIDDILQGNGLTQLAQTSQDILDTLMLVLPKTEEIDEVMVDVRRVLDGLFALDVLKDTVLDEIQVQDLAKDPAYLRWYLTTMLGFNDSVTETLMTAVFSSGVFLRSGEGEDVTCDEVLNRILIMETTENVTVNGTDPDVVTVEDMQVILCNLTEDQIKVLLDQLIPMLDVGELVLKYVTQTTETIFEATDLTSAELDDMVDTIDQGITNLRLVSDIIASNPNGSQLLDAFYGASSSALTMDDLLPTICGSDAGKLFDPEFPTGGLVLVVPSNVALDDITQDELEEIDLPNEFCVSIYESVRDSPLGNILWSYLKPFMRGKILYTPDTPVTREILRRANGTFDVLAEVYEVSTVWAEQASSLKALTETLQQMDDLEEALENSFIRGLVEAALGISSDSLVSTLDALRSGDFNAKDVEALQVAAEFVANYTSCVETNRFVPVASEEELEREAFNLTRTKNFFAGIVFLGLDDEDNDQSNSTRRKRQATLDVPKHITYKIRMDVDNTMNTNELKSSIWKMDAEDNFMEDMRYYRGFIFIQDMIDTAIIEMQKNQILDSPGRSIKQMPFPCHHEDSFVFLLGSYMIPVMMTFVFLTSLGVAAHNFVYDRENGQEATLGVMGMISGLNFIMWLLSTMVVMAVTSFVMAIMLKYTDIFQYSNLLIMFLYILEFCFSSLMLLYMVSSFFTRTTMAILFVLMVYLISYMPYVVLIGMEVSLTFWEKIAACLSSTTAFSFGAMSLSYLEQSGKGLQWDNIDQEVSKDFSMKWSFIMMAVDSGIYFLIGWYVRNVKPGKYGLSQPWYFPLSPTYWCSCLKWRPGFTPEVDPNSGPMFEPAPDGVQVGIALRRVNKVYSGSTKKAVDNLSINFYESQITTLLGHNGAAKTTTLKMLYGVLEPSSGKIMVNGKTPGCGGQSIGICPQQNAVFDYMTVKQHMAFYNGVKGSSMSRPEQMAETKKLLRDVDLWHARHTPVRDLSYGMKRRLCVALAFTGGSKTIILDEPTSGVDPHARKNIWNLITENREGRTILLSTHHLDEADILSDRIALLHQGKLLCCGSPAFLKQTIGRDFRLTVKKAEIAPPTPINENAAAPEMSVLNKSDQHTQSIITFIQSMAPEAKLVEQVGTDLTFNLPKDADNLKVPIDRFFRQLDSSSAQLGVDTYGVSDTTLEEVFLTLTMRADSLKKEKGIVNPVMTSKDDVVTDPENPSTSSGSIGFSGGDKILFSPAAKMQLRPRVTGTGFATDFGNGEEARPTPNRGKRRVGATLTFSQMGAMLLKRFHHYRRNWRIMVSALLMPVICLLAAVGVATLRVDEGDMKELILDPSIYGPDTTSFFQDATRNTMSNSFVDVLKDGHVGYGTTCERSWADEYLKSDICIEPSAWYNYSMPYMMISCVNAWQVYTEMPIDYTMYERRVASDDLLQDVKAEDQSLSLFILRTFKDYLDNRFGGFSFEPHADDSSLTDPMVWFNTKGYHAMPSFFNSMSNTILRAQLYGDKNKSEYGITTINHPIKLGKEALSMSNLEADATDAGLALMIVVAFSFIPGGFILYIIHEKTQKQRQLQNLRGISVFTYWLVSFFWDLLFYSITVGLAAAIVTIFETDGFYFRKNLGAFSLILFLYGWAVIPMLYCLSHAFTSGSSAYLVSFCLNLFTALATVISLLVMQLFRDQKGAWEAYKICRHAYLVFPQFALGQGLIDMVSNTFMYKLFERFDVDRYLDPYSTDVMGWNLVALACAGLFFFLLNLILDGAKGSCTAISSMLPFSATKNSEMDMDVVRERERVKNESTVHEDMLVVDGLSKVYKRGWRKFLPVDDITFGVHEGECFGLLGVNGAGKTTTFRMLTGDSKPATGKAFLRGDRLSFNDKQFGHDIGYCPQEGGLDEYLTGEETIYFHSRLKGFNSEQTKMIANDLLKQLDLTQFANVAVHKYSGGTKRKLALAVALLGEPSILYLDEPTTGMDAVTRRLAWSCIAQANRNGQSVVLTSHSMGECDALCSRIAIMVNGQIKCIGSPQHLKNKFGDGYTVVLHAARNQANTVTNKLTSVFPGAFIKSKHLSRVELLIPYQAAQVADIVAFLQSAEDQRAIDYYSLSQTSLDSVFISFAQEQSDNYEDQTYSSGESSSFDKTDSPSGSVSSDSNRPENVYVDKPDTGRYAFTNPHFVNTEPSLVAPTTGIYPAIDSTRL